MKVIIPVAGKGTRMRPFTHSQPKALLPVAGKAIIDHIVDRIVPLEPTEVVFVTGHLGHAFPEHIKQRYPHLNARFVEQKEQRGTADAVWTARSAFDSDVLVVFSDTIFDADLRIIKDCQCDGIIWAKEVSDPSRFGVCVIDEDGILTRIVEKPATFVSNLANIGLYYVKDTAAFANGIEHTFKTTPQGREFYLTSAFEHMIAHGKRLCVKPVMGWYDTGTVEETLETNRTLLDIHPGHAPKIDGVTIIPPVSIAPSAKIMNSTIGPHVTIADHVTVENSVVKDAIIDAHSHVAGSKLTHSIIGQHVTVRDIEGSLLLGDHSRIGKG